MTRERTTTEARQDLHVMSEGDLAHWYQPTTMRDVAAQPNGMWMVNRLWSRPGDVPGRGPVDVIGAGVDATNHGITARLAPVATYLGAQHSWLWRSWTVSHTWVRQTGQSASLVEVRPAIFGYTSMKTAIALVEFAASRGYGILHRLAAPSDAARFGPAPHVFREGRPCASAYQIGRQRTWADIDAEWDGCNPEAVAEIKGAHQVTLYDPELGTDNRLYADLAPYFGALFTEARP